jgi:two-component system, OmpR family, sensor kinase
LKAFRRLRQSHRWPPRWPIRWKLAGVSAGLTFVILVAFGFAIGQIVTGQLRDNYAADTTATAKRLAEGVRDIPNASPAFIAPVDLSNVVNQVHDPVDLTLASNNNHLMFHGAQEMGPAGDGGVTERGKYQIASVLITFPGYDLPGAILRYGRPIARLDASTRRVWLSILAAVFGATFLAAMASVLISRRTLRPISALTATARHIAETRDPAVALEEPIADDEVAELTRTFNEMLHELSLSRAERERSLKRQREFVADASHELRTPLTSVLANLELLDHSLDHSGSEDDRASVESALRSSQRMRRLVADLQLLARADAGHAKPESNCDLAEIAANAVAEQKPLTEDHEVELKVNGPVLIEGSPDDLHRVVANLVDNSVRYTPAGCTVRVTVVNDNEKGLAVLTVEDDGPGIPEELRAEIFNRFVRSKGPGDQAPRSGTGLGLAIVRAIAETHHGMASVGDSEMGGASFRVEVPQLPEESTEKPLGNS